MKVVTDLEEKVVDTAKVRKELAMVAAAQCVEGFYLAQDQAQHFFPNLDLSSMGMFKEITPTGLVGPDDPSPQGWRELPELRRR